MRKIRSYYWISCAIILFCIACNFAYSQTPLIYINDFSNATKLQKDVFLLEEKGKQETINTVINSSEFIRSSGDLPFYVNDSTSLWVKFSLQNNTALSTLFLSIKYYNISSIILYKVYQTQSFKIGEAGNRVPTKGLDNQDNSDYSFNLFLPSKSSSTYILHIQTTHPLTLPLFVEPYYIKETSINIKNWIIGIYTGIMLAIFFYNLFLFFSTRDRMYLAYIFFVFSFCLAHITTCGLGYKYIWYTYPTFNNYAEVIASSLAFISAIVFSISFLHLNKNKKFKYIYKGLLLIIGLCIFAIISNFLKKNAIAYHILSLVSFIIAVPLLISAALLIKKYKPAVFYLIAWSFLLMSLIIMTLRNFNVIPYNNFSIYASYVGSALETILLSFALANKINVLRKQAERSRMKELATAKENQRLVSEQNVILEKQVAERTAELQESNQNLNQTLVTLKETQSQLVQAEKMASLGILTAGVAHEINNPINFVSSNLRPLELNITDLLTLIEKYELLHKTPTTEIPKLLQEIDTLKEELDLSFLTEEIHTILKTMGEGAKRTADIVEGLRNFSRLDESEFKHVNIHEGLDSTLMLLRSQIPNSIKIIKQYNADGNIDCFPSQLNQAFMNILSNAIQAIKLKDKLDNESITINTINDDNFIYIKITDTGIGMDKETEARIFDPFFTTKDVGEGTGLGLSIVHKIIEKHQGEISVESTVGKGTTFNIQLPRALSKLKNT